MEAESEKLKSLSESLMASGSDEPLGPACPTLSKPRLIIASFACSVAASFVSRSFVCASCLRSASALAARSASAASSAFFFASSAARCSASRSACEAAAAQRRKMRG